MDIRPFASGPAATPWVPEQSGAGAAVVAPVKSATIAVQTAKAVEQAPSAEQTKQAVQKINAAIQSLSQGVVFAIDESSNSTVIKVVDAQTSEVLRQMPSKEALEIARALDRVQGMLIKQKA